MDKSQLTRTVAGIGFLAIGGVLLLENTNLIHIDNLVEDYWPVLIIAGALVVLANNVRSWLPVLFLLTLGGLYQLRALEIISFEPWPVIVSLFFVVLGISFIFKRSYVSSNLTKEQRDDVNAIMGGADTINTSKNFKGAKVTAIMGAAKIDLRKAAIQDRAVIEVFSFWGGVEIIAPKHVVIRNQTNNIMGATEDRTEQETKEGAPELIITGDVIMAGVDIRNTVR